MDEINDFILVIATCVGFFIALPIIAAMVLPIPFILYKVVATIISVIRDAVNGKLSKKLDGSPLDKVSYERYKEFKTFTFLIFFTALFTPFLLIAIAFGPIVIVGFICFIPFYLIIRSFLKRK
jgi:hypothetical protein